MAWSDNVEAHHNSIKIRPNKRRPRHVVLLLLTAVFGTIVFHLVLGALLLCYYTDASPLLALVTTSSHFNKWSATRPPSSTSPFFAFSKNNVELFKKPSHINIVAVVSYRNLERTSILDCYLQSNLVENGGLLDEVIFIPETAEHMQLEWLHETVNKSDSYSIKPSWENLPHANNGDEHNRDLYIKIDGDVVYIEENVIPTIVNTKLQHPKMTLVSANVIHQPAVANFHRRPGVIVPHLFDFNSLKQHASSPSASTAHEHDNQRESTLPYWKNVLTPQWPEWLRGASKSPGTSDEKTPHSTKTNIKTSSTSQSAAQRYTWVSQAQQHNSFLHHLEREDLQHYKFPLWKNPPDEISGAFVCATGADMVAMMTNGDKETGNLSTQSLKQHTLIDGKGVVSHYDGIAGLDGLDSTDVLDRYRRYAEKNVCPKTGS